MKKLTVALYAGITVAILVLGALVWKFYSFPIAVSFADLKSRPISFIQQLDVDSNGNQFCVFQAYTDEGNLALAYATRNELGFWHVDRVKSANETQKYAAIAWSKGAGVRRFTHLENAIFEHEWHFVYTGNDAIKAISFSPGQLPDNSTVNIQQAGKQYTIHLIVFSAESVAFDLRELLIQNGCVKG